MAEQVSRIRPLVPVHFHNWVTQAQLLDRLPRHDIFFLCSRWEGLPIAMVEAMLCGVAPVVPATCAGAGYALHGGGGWLYSATSPSTSADALVSILKDPDAIDRARQTAARNARFRFLGKIPARQTEDCIDTFLKLRSNGRTHTSKSFRPLTRLPAYQNTKSQIAFLFTYLTKHLLRLNQS